jgi:N-acetylmuramoyl-L-alanine amidase
MRAKALGVIGSTWGRIAACAVAFACVVAAAASHGAPAARGVQNVRFGGDQHETRVVIDLDQSAKGRVLDDGGDKAFAIALPNVAVEQDLQGNGQGLVARWAVDDAAGAARIRLDLVRPAVVRRRFLLPPADGVSTYRYVIDLAPSDNAVPAAAPAAPAAPVARGEAQPAATPVAEVTRVHLKKIIVIDAGHGGKDPGAMGAVSHEKDLTLAAARALRARLERTGRYRIVMTRDADTFVPLETRVQIARKAGADLFISLHADSDPQPGMRGATVYTLSDKGSDRVVRNVMAQNDWFINVDLPGRDKAVNQILLDLTQRATRNRSAAFAEDLLTHISDRVQLLRRSHRDAGFVVLLAPDVPAVLLEMGFITNPQDEALLNSTAKRQRFMDAVGDSIDAYFAGHTQVATR